MHNLCIRWLRFGSFFSLHILTLQPCPPFSYTIAFWQVLRYLRIKQSRFGSFSSELSDAAPPPRSPMRSHFWCFRILSAFDCRILAAFAHSWHSMIAFWHVLLNHSIRRSGFGSFSSPHSPMLPLPPVLAYHRILLAFTHSAFDGGIWQLLLTFSIQSSHFGSFRSRCVILHIYACSAGIWLYTARFRKQFSSIYLPLHVFGRLGFMRVYHRVAFFL